MNLGDIASAALAVVLLVLVVRWIWRVRVHCAERAWRPPELEDAELFYVERPFRIRTPIRLVARVDRGYRQPDGSIVLLEFKSRPTSRVYFSDVIELSAQRLAVAAQTGTRVACYAYVLVYKVPSGHRVPHRVNLLPADEVIALARRREAILAKTLLPQCTHAKRLCAGCAFESPCKRMPRMPPGTTGGDKRDSRT
jgi:hypothetical protein